MIRLRSTKLLSGVSTFAVLAALGTAGPAMAGQTFTGPDLFSPYTNSQTDFILVTTNAVMNSDGPIDPEDGNSIINGINMSGAGDKIAVDDSVLVGGILNTGSIVSTDADGIDIRNDSVVVGTINNQGLIQGGTASSGIEINQSVLVGGIFNGIGATITGASNGIYILNDAVFIGGISNEGAISGASGDGIQMSGANVDFIGGIANYATGVITGNGPARAAIDIGFPAATSSFVGNIANTGTIQGLGGGTGIFVNTGAFAGDIVNNSGALITGTSASATAIAIAGGAFTGNITNSGLIRATDSSGVAIDIRGTTVFVGNVTNNSSGVIHAASTALAISSTSFAGNIVNSGQILSDSGTAISITTASFTGDVTNSGTGSITASALAVEITSTAFTGNLTNNGLIRSTNGTAVNVGAATFTGNFSNTGSILGDSDGVVFSGAAFNGNVSNSSGLISGDDGLHVNVGTTITGALTNNGTIVGVASDGIDLEGTVTGVVTNTGTITAVDSAIEVEATVGGIVNSGTLIGAQAIDLSLATGATTVTQAAGLMQGDLRLDQAVEFDDTLNLNGGRLRGNIDGGGGDDIAIAGNFAYESGTADELDQLDVNSGTAVFGSSAVGTNGLGVTFTNTNDMTIAGGATAYLDDNTTIGLNNDLTVNSGATLSYFLTSDTTTHGRINAGGNANLDGTLLAVVDGSTFASIGGNTFTYDDIITGTVAGTFSNVATTSLFFEGKAVYNAGDVDLQLLRLSFNDVLTLGSLTQNQQSVGGALESIYGGGSFGSDFEDLFNYLLNLPAGSESTVAAIYDELGGAEHAQVQQATLRASEAFDTAIGGRLDDAKLSLRGSNWAENGTRRYADAAQQATMTDASASPVGSHGLLRGSSGMSIWGRGYGEWTDVDGDDEAPGYAQDSGGVVAGLDFAVGDNATVGGAFGWSTNSLDFDTPGDRADIDSVEFGGYGTYGFGRFYADAQLSFAFHDVTTTRELDLGFDTVIAGASYNARAWTLAGEVGTVFKLGRISMQPMVGVNYTGASTDGFIESSGSDFALVVADADADSFTSTLGLRVSGVWTAGSMKLVPDASLAWRHEFADDRQNFTAAFLDDPTTQFGIISSKISPDSAVVNAGVTAGVTKGLELFVDYNGIINSDANSHNGSAGFRATW